MGKSKLILTKLVLSIFAFQLAGCGTMSENSVDESTNYVDDSLGSATLSWDRPSTNNDGSALNDLAGFNIYYGPYPGTYTDSLSVGNVTTAKVNNLTQGNWCFVLTAYDWSGNESNYSGEACTVI